MHPAGTWAVALLVILGPAWLSAQTVDRHGSPSVACGADGGFVVVWHSRNQDGDGYGIVANRFRGDAAGSEILVNSYTHDDQRAPAVCSDGQGNFVVAWESYGQDSDGFGIFAQAFDQRGGPRGGEFMVATGSNYSQREVALACADDGGFVVAWSGGLADGDGYGVVGRKFNSNGTSPAGDLLVNTYTSTSQVAPSIAMAPDGGFVVVWTSYDDQDGAGYGVFGQRFSSAGAKLGTEFQVNTHTGNGQLAPAIATDTNGAFVVAWSSAQDSDPGYGVFGQRFTPAGAPDGGEIHINSQLEGDQGVSLGGGRVLDVATGGGDRTVVAWQSTNLLDPAPDGDGIGVFAQRLAGTPPAPVGTEFLVNSTTSGDQAYPSVCVGEAGDFVVVWESRAGAADGIYAQRYDASGARVGSEMRISFDSGGAYSTCVAGDCNQTSSVTISELVTGVNIALGRVAVGFCPAFDPDLSGSVTVDELVAAVRDAAAGCAPRRTPVPAPTPTPLLEEPRTRGIPHGR